MAAPLPAFATESGVGSSRPRAAVPFFIAPADRSRVVTYEEFQPVVRTVREFLQATADAKGARDAEKKAASAEDPPRVLEEKELTAVPLLTFGEDMLPALPAGQRQPLESLRAQPDLHPAPGVVQRVFPLMMTGLSTGAGAACHIRVRSSAGTMVAVGTGMRTGEHRMTILTNKHNIPDHATLLAAEFVFPSWDGTEPIVVRACEAADPVDRECVYVELPARSSLPATELPGFHRPDLAVVRFFPDTPNAAVFDRLEDEDSWRLWPTVVGHLPRATQLPVLGVTAEQRHAIEDDATVFHMPALGQPVAMCHFGWEDGVAEGPLLVALCGQVTDVSMSLGPQVERTMFSIMLHNLYVRGGASGGGIIGPDGELIAVHFAAAKSFGLAVMLTHTVRVTLCAIFRSLPGLSEGAQEFLDKMTKEYAHGGYKPYAIQKLEP